MNGVDMITKERNEQLEKHNYTLEYDKQYVSGELIGAALYCIMGDVEDWPKGWYTSHKDKIDCKPIVQKLAIAGALIAAEIDRLNCESTS